MTGAGGELAPGLQGLERAMAVRKFALAGKAIITLESPITGVHYTYRVKPATDGRWYVDLLTGPQNTVDYVPLGALLIAPAHGGYAHSRFGGLSATAPAARTACWFFGPLAADLVVLARRLPHVRVYHAGRCGRCNRVLTVPSSIERGLGPDCAEMVQ